MPAFLWPRATYHAGSLLRLPQATAASIEAAIQRLFPTGYPVAFSSGRAGLAATLSAIGLSRPDLVRVPPYASHCVLEAVSRVATPMPAGAKGKHAAWLLYHQWGYVQSPPATEAVLIEDACDSFCQVGAPLFPAGGQFELWSLPKILGCCGGGIIWCRNEQDADRLRDTRDSRGGTASLQWLLRMAGSRYPSLGDYWSGREAACGPLSRIAAADILAAIERWPDCAAMRRERLARLESRIPAWLPRPHARLPCVVPVPASAQVEEKIRALGITTGFRHFERTMPDGTIQYVKAFPLPIHQDVDLVMLQEVLALLEQRVEASSHG